MEILTAGVIVVLILIALVLASSIKVVSEWERLAILTLGKYSGLKGPGLIILVPLIQTVANRIDTRVTVSKFQSETTLTKDGVAVTVMAVLFWKVVDSEKATLEVNSFSQAVALAAHLECPDMLISPLQIIP